MPRPLTFTFEAGTIGTFKEDSTTEGQSRRAVLLDDYTAHAFYNAQFRNLRIKSMAQWNAGEGEWVTGTFTPLPDTLKYASVECDEADDGDEPTRTRAKVELVQPLRGTDGAEADDFEEIEDD